MTQDARTVDKAVVEKTAEQPKMPGNETSLRPRPD